MSNNLEVDLTLALQLQAQFQEEFTALQIAQEKAHKEYSMKAFQWKPQNKELPEPEQEKLSVSLVDRSWEVLDPNPDILSLFLTFNSQFFWGRLSGIEVKWSPKMTLCAGVCSYEGRGGLCSVRLSVPLLKLRPRRDLIETLLHEMIHAYLFVTHNNRDHDGHGPNFHSHMHRINKIAATNISVYHNFHDEVAVYRQHIWQCNGPCRSRRPFFGLVKRSMNRAPGPRDFWWARHKQECGGSYTKLQEPEGYGVKRKRITNKQNVSSMENKNSSQPDIRKFLRKSSDFQNVKKMSNNKNSSTNNLENVSSIGIFSTNQHSKTSQTPQGSTSIESKILKANRSNSPKRQNETSVFKVFSGSGVTLGGSTGVSRLVSNFNERSTSHCSSNTITFDSEKFDNSVVILSDEECELFPCPICARQFPSSKINSHTNSHFT